MTTYPPTSTPYHDLCSVKLSDLLFQQYAIRCICAVARFDVAELLASGAMSARDLAASAGLDEGALYRILRYLSSVGIFTELPDRRFENNGMSDCLRSSHPASVRYLAQYIDFSWHRAAWDHMDHTLRTGEPAFNDLHGESLFQWLEDKPDFGDVVWGFTTAFGAHSFPPILAAYDFSQVKTLVDVACGPGHDVVKILTKYPHMEAICFEMPGAIEHTRRLVTEHGLADRVELVAGDMFESVPSGGDLYFLKQICHNWSDDHVVRLLTNVKRAMPTTARLLIAEFIADLGEARDAAFAKLVDIWMMVVMTGGRNRTIAEHRENIRQAGLEVSKIVPTGSPQTIVEVVVASEQRPD